MIPAGYMYKYVSERPSWIEAEQVQDIYSMSPCTSKDFYEDWVSDWSHNGYWLFNDSITLGELVKKHEVEASRLALFFYYVYDQQWDSERNQWVPVRPDNDFHTRVVCPEDSTPCGFDLVTFSVHSRIECSPLSCNGIASAYEVNSHCLLNSLDEAQQLAMDLRFHQSEPGPYRIFEVHETQ